MNPQPLPEATFERLATDAFAELIDTARCALAVPSDEWPKLVDLCQALVIRLDNLVTRNVTADLVMMEGRDGT